MASVEAKGGLTIEYPQLQIGDNIFVTQGLYKGTPADLEAVKALSQTPAFLKKYPNHTVFVDGTVVIGALPLDTKVRNSPEYKVVRDQLNAKLKEREREVAHCALVRTGQVAPAPEPILVPFMPVASSAPTR